MDRENKKRLKPPKIGMFFLVSVVIVVIIAGIFARYYYVFAVHPPQNFVYSDMSTYYQQALRLTTPGTDLGPSDTIYPPGAGLLFGFLLGQDISWERIQWAQLVFSVSILIGIFFVGLMLYGMRVAAVSISIASIYIPFIYYAGFLLSEIIFTCVMLFCFLFFIVSLKTSHAQFCILCATFSGVLLGGAALVRSIIFLPAFVMVLVLLWFWVFRAHSNALRVLAWSLVGAAIIIAPFVPWCTSLNEGNLCIISTNGALNFLQGHYGDTSYFAFRDVDHQAAWLVVNPTALQKFEDVSIFSIGPYESAELFSIALGWIRAHPLETLRSSSQHVADLFYGSIPFPISRLILVSEYIFRIFILLPAILFLTITVLRRFLQKQTPGGSGDLIVFAPIVGLMLVAFLVIGEPRLRIPFDIFFILLAARAYTFGRISRKGIYPEQDPTQIISELKTGLLKS